MKCIESKEGVDLTHHSSYLTGFQYLKEGELVATAQLLIEPVHRTADSLFYRRVVTEDQDTWLHIHELLDKTNMHTHNTLEEEPTEQGLTFDLSATLGFTTLVCILVTLQAVVISGSKSSLVLQYASSCHGHVSVAVGIKH